VRWGRESKPGTTKALEDGRRVAFSTVAGRTTATVPGAISGQSSVIFRSLSVHFGLSSSTKHGTATQGRTPKYGDQSAADAEWEAAEAVDLHTTCRCASD